MKHMLVRTKTELHNALCKCRQQQTDCVIEVESSIEGNTYFHRFCSAKVIAFDSEISYFKS